jgi:hypothetical protein
LGLLDTLNVNASVLNDMRTVGSLLLPCFINVTSASATTQMNEVTSAATSTWSAIHNGKWPLASPTGCSTLHCNAHHHNHHSHNLLHVLLHRKPRQAQPVQHQKPHLIRMEEIRLALFCFAQFDLPPRSQAHTLASLAVTC